MTGHRSDPIYGEFMNRFIDTMHATPLYVTLLAGIALYGYALGRGLPGTGNALAAAVASWRSLRNTRWIWTVSDTNEPGP